MLCAFLTKVCSSCPQSQKRALYSKWDEPVPNPITGLEVPSLSVILGTLSGGYVVGDINVNVCCKGKLYEDLCQSKAGCLRRTITVHLIVPVPDCPALMTNCVKKRSRQVFSKLTSDMRV